MTPDSIESRQPTSDSSESKRKTTFWEFSSSNAPSLDETTSFLEKTKEESLSKKDLRYPIADRALSFWLSLKQKVGEPIPEPTIGVNESGEILFSWNLGSSYLECEFQNSVSEVFFEHFGEGVREFDELPQVHSSEANWIAKRLEAHL